MGAAATRFRVGAGLGALVAVGGLVSTFTPAPPDLPAETVTPQPAPPFRTPDPAPAPPSPPAPPRGAGGTAEDFCSAARERFLAGPYAEAVAAVGDVRQPPKLGQPWHFSNDAPFCGQVLLCWLTSGGSLYALAVETDGRWEPPPARLPASTGSRATLRMLNCGRVSTSQPRWDPQTGAAKAEGWPNQNAWPPPSRILTVGDSSCRDVFFSARVVGSAGIASAEVVPASDPPCSFTVSMSPPLPGEYQLEVKAVHVNGNTSDPSLPFSLGVVGIRGVLPGRVGKAAKTYYRNTRCDAQRHVIGSPLTVVAEGQRRAADLPRCGPAAPTGAGGWWVRHDKISAAEASQYYVGNPTWLTDACGFNNRLVWVPSKCKLAHWGPGQPPTDCPGAGNTTVAVLGDSVAREYTMACKQIRGGSLSCSHWHHKVEGKYYSKGYAAKVAVELVNRLNAEKPAALVTNLGMLHMIGPCHTDQWLDFVTMFRDEWRKRPPPVKRAIWVGSSRIHWAWLGMGPTRGIEWSTGAYRILETVGFEWLNADELTAAREDATWDGAHYSAELGHKQTVIRLKGVPKYKWNGGVANALLNAVANMLCHTSRTPPTTA
eukprot:TRINITY_DN32718_c0_g1_i1.p1 TRINITY_DN32718_c0_g1~~TRINITY_DN32718_c0_g1_i1.p1  ORF type:complete len:620 (+),score=181.78 TRINITY_DN32718_c0_g1_i1:58-1860(+)